ncbi:DHHC zinc finger protein (macronuclear) [Tetrahymena thermophila SB210]|uniref:DHHC zinc finger protein n=1 Tax=Tetrahymena thermophila (strain SB210) TaxID=312017 RepID=Q24C03_TETTS|nr:DHHC zinc finger protein [Tetrahymena thermophila SB210]EAS05299.2 DHHC zinc finger protein [Tetrahymena thermophila SB210]|eukprot:XP_001025544.2 DHHC zinc finger protein [Tetrahymena thermophila SB210]
MLSNVTTIEQLEKIKEQLDNGNQKDKLSVLDNVESNQNVYDLGKRKNFYQVFGQNPILWLLPVFGESGRPYGDGVAWNKNSFQKQITLETKDLQANLKDQGVSIKSDENKQQNQQSYEQNQDQLNQNNQSLNNQQLNQSFINQQSNKSFVNQQNNANQSNNPLNITQNNNNSFFQEYQSSLIINLLNNTQSQTNVGNQVHSNLQNVSPKQTIYQIQSRYQVQN